MQTPLQIHFHNVDHSDAVEQRIREECSKLEQFCDEIISCHVTVEEPHRRHHKGNLFSLKIRLVLPNTELISSHEQHERHAHEDPYVMIHDRFRAMRRQLEDYARKRQGKVKTHVSPQSDGRIARLLPEQDCGFILTADGREIYFHRNSVVDGSFDRLAEGDELRFVEEAGAEGPQASSVFVGG
jgi:ribosome-associated translation inhibitor RaiA/cold shock CspA family protein